MGIFYLYFDGFLQQSNNYKVDNKVIKINVTSLHQPSLSTTVAHAIHNTLHWLLLPQCEVSGDILFITVAIIINGVAKQYHMSLQNVTENVLKQF